MGNSCINIFRETWFFKVHKFYLCWCINHRRVTSQQLILCTVGNCLTMAGSLLFPRIVQGVQPISPAFPAQPASITYLLLVLPSPSSCCHLSQHLLSEVSRVLHSVILNLVTSIHHILNLDWQSTPNVHQHFYSYHLRLQVVWLTSLDYRINVITKGGYKIYRVTIMNWYYNHHYNANIQTKFWFRIFWSWNDCDLWNFVNEWKASWML